MEPWIERALVVDSGFESRRQLLSDIRQSGLVRLAEPAKSLVEGLDQIASTTVDGCFIGPSVTPHQAVSFVRSARNSAERRMAIVAVVHNPPSSYISDLISAGVNATLDRPYTESTFTKVVERAVESVNPDRAKLLRELKLQAERAASAVTQIHLVKGLQVFAEQLAEIASSISNGSLGLQRDGLPTLATSDAIRLAVEQLMPPAAMADRIGTFDHHFVTSIVEWFSERVTMSPRMATESLRRRLVSFANNNQG